MRTAPRLPRNGERRYRPIWRGGGGVSCREVSRAARRPLPVDRHADGWRPGRTANWVTGLLPAREVWRSEAGSDITPGDRLATNTVTLIIDVI